jgi:hypothetical protein
MPTSFPYGIPDPAAAPSLTEQAIQQALLMGAQNLDPSSAVREGEFVGPQEKPYSPKFRKFGLGPLLAGTGLDVATTYLAGNNPNLKEANPILGSNPKQAAIISALLSGGMAFALDKLAQKSPAVDKLATGLGIGLGGLRGGIGVHNLRMLGR